MTCLAFRFLAILEVRQLPDQLVTSRSIHGARTLCRHFARLDNSASDWPTSVPPSVVCKLLSRTVPEPPGDRDAYRGSRVVVSEFRHICEPNSSGQVSSADCVSIGHVGLTFGPVQLASAA